jgi:hypothetical protein
MTCTHCGAPDANYRGIQRGIDPRNGRFYSFAIYNCDHGCGTSFGGEKRYIDGACELVPAKCAEGGQS